VSKSQGFVLCTVLTLTLATGPFEVAQTQQAIGTLSLSSSSFAADAVMPNKYTCGSAGRAGIDNAISPELSWTSPPARTQSFVLIANDKDSMFHSLLGYFVHWLLYDLPADKRELSEGVPKQEQLPDGSRQGLNGFDKVGYVGPCPPGKSAHHYTFALYALDSKLNLPGSATEKQIRKAMTGHILASSELVGHYPQ